MTRRRLGILGAAILSTLVLACSGDDSDPPTDASSGDPATCATPSLDATILPSAFEDGLRPGSGGQVVLSDDGAIEPLADQPASTHHFRGPVGVYIDVVQGDENIAAFVGDEPLAKGPVDVLGASGRAVDVHEGIGVLFELGEASCDHFLLAAYGIGRADLISVAGGLQLSDQ